MAYLEYGLDQHEGFLVLTGDPGTGKTTLIHKLEASLNRQFFVAKIDISPGLSNKELLKLVAAALGLKNPMQFKESVDVSLAIRDLLSIQFQHNRRVILFFDECHHLSYETLEELRLLSNIQHRGVPLLQCFLVGQTSFRDVMKQPELEQMRQRVVAVCHLHALNGQETGEYIRHRLERAGNKGRDVFSNGAINIIHDFAMGVPRRINRVCDRALLYASIEDKHFIDEQVICEVINELSDEMEVRFDVSQYQSKNQSIENYPILVEGGDVVSIFSRYRSTSTVPSEVKPSISLHVFPEKEAELVVDKAQSKIDEEEIPVLTVEAQVETVDVIESETQASQKNEWLRTGAISLVTVIIVSIASLAVLETMFGEVDNSQAINRDKLVNLVMLDTSVDDNAVPTDLREEPTFQQVILSRDLEPEVEKNIEFEDSPVNEVLPPSHSMAEKTLDEAVSVADISSFVVESNESEALVAIKAEKPQSIKENVNKSVKTNEPEKEKTLLVASNSVTKPKLVSKPIVTKIKPTEKKLATQVAMQKKEKQQVKIVKPVAMPIAKVKPVLPVVQKKPKVPVKKTIAATGVEKEVLPKLIAHKELNNIINDFMAAYKKGDIDELALVLSENIKTNDTSDRQALTDSYQKLFSITQRRQLQLTDMLWDKAENKAVGKGRFEATILEQGRAEPRVFRGSIAMNVEKRDVALAITEMYYQYE